MSHNYEELNKSIAELVILSLSVSPLGVPAWENGCTMWIYSRSCLFIKTHV